MKKSAFACAASLAFLGLGVFIYNQLYAQGGSTDEGGPPMAKKKSHHHAITATGSATVKIQPDSARVSFGVETIAATIKEARADNAIQVKKVLSALRSLKIPDLKIKSADLQVELLRSERFSQKLAKITGYHITNSFTALVECDDPQKLSELAGKVLDTALESGANQVQYISFFKKDLASAKRKAMILAVENALDNAKALAKGANVKISDTMTIQSEPEYGFPFGMANTQMVQTNVAMPGGNDSGSTLIAGDLLITCRVQVKCAY